MKHIFGSILLCSLLFCGCKIEKCIQAVPASAKHKLISLTTQSDECAIHAGDTLECTFITNTSTGHRWRWMNKEYNSHLDSLSQHYYQEHPELIGSSAKMYWRFIANSPGIDTLHFVYGPCYNNDIIVKERKITVHIME